MIRNQDCSRCKLSAGCKVVCDILQPQKRSDVMVIGETPAARGDQGHIRKILARHGIARPYFVSAVNCEPEKGKKPTDAQVTSCRVYVQKQIKKVKPKFVLLMGNAALYSIKSIRGINKERGRPFEHKGVIYLPTWTPGNIFYDPATEATIDRDIKLLADIVAAGEIPREKRLRYTLVDTKKKLMRMLAKLRGEVAFDIETTGLFPWMRDARVTALSFAVRGKQYVVPGHHRESPWYDFEQIVAMIDRRVRKHNLRLITHNGKFDYLWMKVHFKVDWQKYAYFDTMIAHYLLDENTNHGLKRLAQVFLGAPDWDVGREVKVDGPMNKLSFYAAHDVFYTLQLKYVLSERLRQEPDVRKVFQWIMMPVVRLFTQIEYNGVYVDINQFAEAEQTLHKRIGEAELKLKDVTRNIRGIEEINWGSPQQISDLLYTKLRLPVVERTEKGNPSVSESVLMRTDHPVARALIEYRGAKQQLSFFIEGWKPYLVDGWLHPNFKLHGTVTGRLSCENPNLQQVPRDGFIRSLITAPPGWEFLEADLSQIELRVAAELAGSKSLYKCFTTGVDVHWLTALTEIQRGKGKKKEVLATGKSIAKKEVKYNRAIELMLKAGPDACIDIWPGWKELRKKAKAVNFGYLFGMWWRKFKIYARDNYGVDVTDEQAQESRENFFELYPELEDWHRRQKRMARTQGYVTSLSGRRRRLPKALLSQDTPERREAERQAINSPVQGFANELNLMTAIQMAEEYGVDKVRMCGTVHDSIIFLVKRKYVVEVHDRILEIMRRPKLFTKLGIKMKVPIEGEVKIGAWSKGVTLERWQHQQRLKRSTASSGGTVRKSSTSPSYALAA
jgi:uracil-DNA glycosylase family 4